MRGVGVKTVPIPIGDGKDVTLYDESHALLIGVSANTKGWLRLDGVEEDIKAVGAVLKTHGFKLHTVMNPTRDELKKQVEEFILNYAQKEKNRILIYFAGHGMTVAVNDQQLGYLVAADTTNLTDPKNEEEVRNFRRTAIPITTFTDTHAKEIGARHAFFVFDSCFSGSLLTKLRGDAVPPAISIKTTGQVRQYLTAGTANQAVSDKSIFRQAFEQALKGDADSDNDGYVTGSELTNYVFTRVSNLSKNRQTPLYARTSTDAGTSLGDIVFALPKALQKGVLTVGAKPGARVFLYRPQETRPAHAQFVDANGNTKFSGLEIANYKVVASLEGFPEQSVNVSLTVGKPEDSISLNLTRREYSVTIKTNVPDGIVKYTLSGKESEQLKSIKNNEAVIEHLTEGEYQLEVRDEKGEYEIKRATIRHPFAPIYDLSLNRKKAPETPAPVLPVATGTLIVTALENAELILYAMEENKAIEVVRRTLTGKKTEIFPQLPLKRYRVQATLSGYGADQKEIELLAGDPTHSIELNLNLITYPVVIKTNINKGTYIYNKIGNKPEPLREIAGNTIDLQLATGTYEITLNGGPEYYPATKPFTLPLKESLEIKLLKRESRGAHNIPLTDENLHLWETPPKGWQIKDNIWEVIGKGQALLTKPGAKDFKDFALQVRFSLIDERETILIFRVQDTKNYYQVRVLGKNNVKGNQWASKFEVIEDGRSVYAETFEIKKDLWKPGDYTTLLIKAKGGQFDLSLDNGMRVFALGKAFDSLNRFPVGAIGVAAMEGTAYRVSQIYVCNWEDCDESIKK